MLLRNHNEEKIQLQYLLKISYTYKWACTVQNHDVQGPILKVYSSRVLSTFKVV